MYLQTVATRPLKIYKSLHRPDLGKLGETASLCIFSQVPGYWKHIELTSLWQSLFHSGGLVCLIDAHVVCHAAAISSHHIQLGEVLHSHPSLQNRSDSKSMCCTGVISFSIFLSTPLELIFYPEA